MRDLTAKTFLVTGSNTGIGRATAQALAARGARVVFACRSPQKAAVTIAAVRAATGNDALSFLHLDLSDFSSVRHAALGFLAGGRPLDVLVNNAGLAGTSGLTPEGYELQYGVNHLGHFLLTLLLRPALEAAEAARVVNVSSDLHLLAEDVPFDRVRQPAPTKHGLAWYEISKLCNALFTRELAKRWDGSVRAYAVHPGVVASDIWRHLPPVVQWPIKKVLISPETGARTSLFCATSPQVAEMSGRYYAKERESAPSHVAQDDTLAALLWEQSEAAVKRYLK